MAVLVSGGLIASSHAAPMGPCTNRSPMKETRAPLPKRTPEMGRNLGPEGRTPKVFFPLEVPSTHLLTPSSQGYSHKPSPDLRRTVKEKRDDLEKAGALGLPG